MSYAIFNRSKNTISKHEGDFPIDIVNEKVIAGEHLFIVSLYSNTISFGVRHWNGSENEVEWVQLPLDEKQWSRFKVVPLE